MIFSAERCLKPGQMQNTRFPSLLSQLYMAEIFLTSSRKADLSRISAQLGAGTCRSSGGAGVIFENLSRYYPAAPQAVLDARKQLVFVDFGQSQPHRVLIVVFRQAQFNY
jgi:hypothetical protein